MHAVGPWSWVLKSPSERQSVHLDVYVAHVQAGLAVALVDLAVVVAAFDRN